MTEAPIDNSISSVESKPFIERPYRERLQEKAEKYAERRIESALRTAIKGIVDYNPRSIPQKGMGMRDEAFCIPSLFELSEVGILHEIASVKQGATEVKRLPIGQITIERLSSTHVGLLFPSDLDLTKERKLISARLSSSPVAEAFVKKATEILNNQPSEDPLTFSFNEDPLETAAALDTLNFFGFEYLMIPYNGDKDPEDIARECMATKLKKNAVVDSRGNIHEVSFEITEGVKVKFLPVEPINIDSDLLTARWRLGIATDKTPYLLETGDQSPSAKCEAFINRPTGIEFISALEQSGLKFTESFENFITTGAVTGEFSDRYGAAYAQISRVLANAIISRDLKQLGAIFTDKQNSQPTIEQLRLLANYESTDPGFNAFKDVLRDLLALDQKGEHDPKMTKARISMRSGACFDVASYYCQAPSLGKLKLTEKHGQKFFEKTHGAHTFLNIKDIEFGGVTLPRGSLFVIGEDGGLAFLRFTPFMFDSREDMVSSFGTEVIKAEKNGEDLLSIVKRIKIA